jgi:hypothetical protein
MSERKKWIKLVAALLEATQNNETKWSLKLPPDTLYQSGEQTDQVYETGFMDKEFRLYPYSYKCWTDEDRFEWSEGVKLEFIDNTGRSLFVVPAVEGIGDLLEAVKYQTAEIDDFLEKLVT